MAYRKKAASRSRTARRSTARGSRSRTYRSARGSGYKAPSRKRRAAPARKRYRKTVKPAAIRIELVNAPASTLSPYEQQMEKMRAKTEPKKARF